MSMISIMRYQVETLAKAHRKIWIFTMCNLATKTIEPPALTTCAVISAKRTVSDNRVNRAPNLVNASMSITKYQVVSDCLPMMVLLVLVADF